MRCTIRHWLPLLTICPVNNLPDLLYVSVTFENEFQELYAVRRKIKKIANFRKAFMETIANSIAAEFPSAVEVNVSLLFNRHLVTVRKQ